MRFPVRWLFELQKPPWNELKVEGCVLLLEKGVLTGLNCVGASGRWVCVRRGKLWRCSGMIKALVLGYVFGGEIHNAFEVGSDLIIKLQNF